MAKKKSSPESIAQSLIDSLIAEASAELKMAPADLARITAEFSAIGIDFLQRGASMTEKDAAFMRRSKDTALATAGVRNLGRADRAQTAALNLALAMLIGSSMPGVDLSNLAHQ